MQTVFLGLKVHYLSKKVNAIPVAVSICVCDNEETVISSFYVAIKEHDTDEYCINLINPALRYIYMAHGVTQIQAAKSLSAYLKLTRSQNWKILCCGINLIRYIQLLDNLLRITGEDFLNLLFDMSQVPNTIDYGILYTGLASQHAKSSERVSSAVTQQNFKMTASENPDYLEAEIRMATLSTVRLAFGINPKELLAFTIVPIVDYELTTNWPSNMVCKPFIATTEDCLFQTLLELKVFIKMSKN